MKKAILLVPFVVAACAQKNIQSESNVAGPSSSHAESTDKSVITKPAFFLTIPQPTTPVEVVFDTSYDTARIVNYRQSEKLHMSGSATFGLKAIKTLAKPAKKVKAALTVFDLRQESHGYINDKPMTWSSPNDWGLADLNHDEAIQRERRLLLDTPLGSNVAGKKVQSLETEESAVQSRGYEYIRLTVTSHLRPSDTEVDRFLEAVKALPEKNWVHFHGREGKDRTTLFMAMYDMLRNAKADSLEDIVKRNEDLSHDGGLLDLPAHDNALYVYQKERAEFLREFYNFAKAHPDGKDMLWTEWIKK